MRAGPWGELELCRIIILPAEGVIPPGWADPPPTQWFFAGHASETLDAWLRSLGLPEGQQARLFDPGRRTTEPDGVRLLPGDDLVLALAPAHRLAIADVLGQSDRNPAYASPRSVRGDELEAALRTAGSSPAMEELVRRVIYRHGRRLYLADVFAALNRLDSRAEKLRLVRLASSSPACFVHFHVRPDDSPERLAAYWGGRGRRKDLVSLFESLRALPNGGHLDLGHLLPTFARQRLYSYPHPALLRDAVRRDCHWTTLNFFSYTPDDRFGVSEEAQCYILEHDYPVGETPQFGDLVFLWRPGGAVIHSRVYLAANLVFTKNGDTARQPWAVMDLDDVREIYSVLAPDGMTVRFWRNLDYEN